MANDAVTVIDHGWVTDSRADTSTDTIGFLFLLGEPGV